MEKLFLIKEIILFIVGSNIIINGHDIVYITLGSIFTILSIVEMKKSRCIKGVLDIILGILMIISILLEVNLIFLFVIWLILNSIFIILDYITNDDLQSIFKIVIGIMSIILAIILIVKPIGNEKLFPSIIAIYFIITSVINIGIWFRERMRYN